MSTRTQIESLADVQRLLLPDQPRIPGLEYAVHYQPAEIAAGDYYDLMLLPAGGDGSAGSDAKLPNWGVMVGDVSGHGPAAAMEAVQFDAILRTYRGDEAPGGPAGALTYANRYYFSRRPRPHFMTVFAARHRPGAGELDFVSAGHPPALLRRGGQVIALGEDGDIPLGINRDHRFSNVTCRFGPGDLLVVFTDGLHEAVAPQGQAFGLARVRALVEAAPMEPAAMLEVLRSALFEHQRGTVGLDDQTILVLAQSD